MNREKATPLVSVIVPVYNAENYLSKCIDSILGQTFPDFELLLIDDGSKDSSGAICDQYAKVDKRVCVIHKANGGVSSARNMGIKRAKGIWIQFCDSDDWLSPDALETMYRAAESNQSNLVFCDFWMVYPIEQKRVNATDWNSDKVVSLSRYIASTWTMIWMILAKRSLYIEYNLLYPEKITYCEDFHLAVRLCYYAHHITVVHQPLYYYNQMNSGSIMASMGRGEAFDKTQGDEINAYLDIIEFFKNNNNYHHYEKVMSWRILKAKQVWVLSPTTWNSFLELVPESKKYIWSCPFINFKLKLMIWCLTHRLSWITGCIVKFRTWIGR